MDVSKYLGAAFLKLDDVKANGPMRLVITDIEDGKYDRANLSFDDSTRLSCNTTGMRALARAYGTESDTWIGKEVELSVGKTEIDGEMQEMILVTPISPAIPRAEWPQPKPKKKPRGDMDDEIAF